MPLTLKQGQQKIDELREKRSTAETSLFSSRNTLASLQREFAKLKRSGASVSEQNNVKSKLKRATSTLDALRADIQNINGSLGTTIDDIIAQIAPEDMYKQLDGSIPVAMLPYRLETRYRGSGTATELLIRIYPDQIHIDSHRQALSATEIELGKHYWSIRQQGDATLTKRAWVQLGQQTTPTRAAWIVNSLTPVNLDSGGDALQFPVVSERFEGNDDAPRARLLPDRWVAIGFSHDFPLHPGIRIPEQRLFQKWGATIPDTLNVGVSFDDQAETVEGDDELPVDSEMLWTVDYDEALKSGMAITIKQSDLPRNSKLADGVGFLLVFGVDWSLSPEQGSAAMESQLDIHRYTDGLAFVPHGTPTNNTGDVRSGMTTDPVALAKLTDPSTALIVGTGDNAAGRLTDSFGLESSSTLFAVHHAGITEQKTESLLCDALWESTLGYYLDALIDPLATDAYIDLARDHAANYLHPGGPFSSIRVGKQPYGVIPAIARQKFKADRSGGVEAHLDRLLNMLRFYWELGATAIPYMGKSDDPDKDLLSLLQMNPVSVAKRYSRTMDADIAANLEGMEDYQQVYANVLRTLVLNPLASVTTSQINAAKIAQMVTSPTNYPLYGPWVQQGKTEAGATLEPNYIRTVIDNLRGGSAGRKALHAQTNSGILLEALLAYAALRELDRGASKLLDKHLFDIGILTQLASKSSLQARAQTGLQAAGVNLAENQLLVETPEQQAALTIPAITGNNSVTLGNFIAAQVSKPQPPEQPELRNLQTFITSLEKLTDQSVDEIDYAFKSVLDAYSYRFDAWQTSLASRRLNKMRKKTPKGLYLGGYSWVSDLRPDKQPDSLGYIHTPSVAQAATAAIMRSGHLSHRLPENASRIVAAGTPESALNIDLSSERVHQAMSLLEGVAQGQQLTALLGYRFERGLRDRDIKLTQFVLPIRKLCPLRGSTPASSDDPEENIAARDVVDGVKLIELWRKNSSRLLLRIKNPTPTVAQRKMINREIARVDDMLDAVADTLVSESVYQTVRGNYDRAGAALAALERQSQPPQPQVVRTPRSGTMYQQRVVLVMQGKRRPDGWSGIATDTRAQLEPQLDAWLASTIGDPDRFELGARIENVDGSLELISVSLHEFMRAEKISPLSLVLLSVATNAKMPSEFELLLVRHFAMKIVNANENTTLELIADVQNAGSDDKIGFSALHSMLQMLNRTVVKQRPADARDFIAAEGDFPDNVDTSDLSERFDALASELSQSIEALEASLGERRAAGLRKALLAAFHLGVNDALPDSMMNSAEAIQELSEQASRTHELLVRKQAQLSTSQELFDAAGEETNAAVIAHLVGQIRLVMGEAFPVLPVFSASNGDELSASLKDRAAMLGEHDEFTPLTWLQQLATVRPQIERYVSALTAAEMLGTSLPADHFQLMQLPHKPGQAWAALQLPGEDAEPLLALLTLGTYDIRKPVSAIVCDGWSEVIPAAAETTGITFHYDAPGARAPQSVILAVLPDLDQTHWDFESIENTIISTYELAKLRAVGPKHVFVLGAGLLPMIYLPQDKTQQRPSIDLSKLAERWKTADIVTRGKLNTHGFNTN